MKRQILLEIDCGGSICGSCKIGEVCPFEEREISDIINTKLRLKKCLEAETQAESLSRLERFVSERNTK